MHQGKYARETQRSLSHEGAELLKRIKLPVNSVCVSCIGWQMGEVVMTARPSFSNQQINTIVPNSKVDASFLYYSLSTRKQELLSLGSATGVRTPILNKSGFCDTKLVVPPLPVQQRIVNILSAYDELIENSQRRIKILEAMARGLYREWFVHFRFPGHENHPRVASALGEIPQGWEVKAIQEFGKVVTGKTPSKANAGFFGEDVPFVKTPDMHGNLFILGTNESLSTVGANSQANKTLPVGSICVSCIGTIGVVSITTEDCQTNQQINSVVLAKSEYREFLFLRLQEAKQALENLGSNGATMGNVNKSKFETMEIVAPLDAHLFDFHRLTQPMFNSILNLTRQVQNLRATRDLLLPRLLSGQINVEAP
jgi:type I restriction enzyme S subunit